MPKIKILIVDESVVVRRLLANVFDADAALEVVGTAPNGKIALAKISQVNPDLIVLDVEMLDMEGLETLAAIRQQDKEIPVIIFSALTNLGTPATLEALSLGATDYVTKPENMKGNDVALQYVREQLIPKIKRFSKIENKQLLEGLHPEKIPVKPRFVYPYCPVTIKSKITECFGGYFVGVTR
jgi:two-component system, chemotaxis family, protein-glutamate methylesterase/glutaminase